MEEKKCYTMCVSLKREPPAAKFYFCGKFLENVESHQHIGVERDTVFIRLTALGAY